jgi:hypothetical protein
LTAADISGLLLSAGHKKCNKKQMSKPLFESFLFLL